MRIVWIVWNQLYILIYLLSSFNYTGGTYVCNNNDSDVCDICAMLVQDCGKGFLFLESSMELMVFWVESLYLQERFCSKWSSRQNHSVGEIFLWFFLCFFYVQIENIWMNRFIINFVYFSAGKHGNHECTFANFMKISEIYNFLFKQSKKILRIHE